MRIPVQRNDPQSGHFSAWCDGLAFNRFHALVLVLAGVTLVFDGYDSQVLAYVMPQLIREWKLSPVVAGSIASFGFAGLMVGAAGFGMIADRIGRKRALLAALVVFSTFSGAAYWATTFQVFCVLRFLAGLGMGGAMPLTITLVSEFAPARVRAMAVTAMFGGFTLGWALAALAAMLVIPLLGWRMLLLFGFLPIALVPVLMVALPESIRFLSSRGRYEAARREIRKLERAARVSPRTWADATLAPTAVAQRGSVRQLFRPGLARMTILIWATYFANLLVVYGLATWLPTLLVRSGHSLVRSYGFGLVQAVGASVGGFLLGWMMDAFGRKAGLVIAYLLGGIVIWLFGIVTAPLALYVIGAATGVFAIGAQIAQHVVTGEVYPTEIRSTGVGWALTVGRIGSIAGPLLGGALQSAGLGFGQYFLIFAIPSFVCAALVLVYRVNVKGEGLEAVHERLRAPAPVLVPDGVARRGTG